MGLWYAAEFKRLKKMRDVDVADCHDLAVQHELHPLATHQAIQAMLDEQPLRGG